MTPRIALVGDFRPEVVARGGARPLLGMDRDDPARLERGARARLPHAIWCVPGSPYASTEGALAAIRFARETRRPFLGTCGGFQHALLELASACWGVERPTHAELEPAASDPVIAPLACPLVGEVGELRFVQGSRLAGIYGAPTAVKAYHCRYGLNPRYALRLESGPLRVSARDANAEVRAVELDAHPFFVATLYQPERAALDGRLHPLIAAYVAATRAAAAS